MVDYVRVFYMMLRDRRGVTSLEYGIFAALLIAAITAAFTTFGSDLSTAFTTLGGALTAATDKLK